MTSVDQQEEGRLSAVLDDAITATLNLRSSLDESLAKLDPEDNVNPTRVEKTVQSVMDFLHTEIVKEAYLAAPNDAFGRQPVNDSFLRRLGETSREIHRYLAAQEHLNLINTVLNYYHEAFKAAANRNSRTQHRFLVPQKQLQLDNALQGAIAQLDAIAKGNRTDSSLRRIERAATSAEASANAASRAAGVTADATVSSHFSSMADKELKSANKFRLWTMGTMSVGGIIAAVFLIGPAIGLSSLEIEPGDYVHMIQRILVVGAVFAFAAYTGRQAHNHRTQANWADSLAVQLKSFDAYCDAISDPKLKDQLRTTFAARAFGEHPALRGESNSDNGDALVQKAADLVSKLLPGDK